MGDAASENEALNAEHDAAMRARQVHRRRIWCGVGHEVRARKVRVVDFKPDRNRVLLELEFDTLSDFVDNSFGKSPT